MLCVGRLSRDWTCSYCFGAAGAGAFGAAGAAGAAAFGAAAGAAAFAGSAFFGSAGFLAAGGVGFFWQCALRFWPAFVVTSFTHMHSVLPMQVASGSTPAQTDAAFLGSAFFTGAAFGASAFLASAFGGSAFFTSAFAGASGAFCCALATPLPRASARAATHALTPQRMFFFTAVISSWLMPRTTISSASGSKTRRGRE